MNIKLFDKAGVKVYEAFIGQPAAKEVGAASLLIHKGTHYAYRGLYGPAPTQRLSAVAVEQAYARFDECAAPLVLE